MPTTMVNVRGRRLSKLQNRRRKDEVLLVRVLVICRDIVDQRFLTIECRVDAFDLSAIARSQASSLVALANYFLKSTH